MSDSSTNVVRRIENVSNQIGVTPSEIESNLVSNQDSDDVEITKAFDSESLNKYLFPYKREMREPLMNEILSCPLLSKPVFGLSLKEERELTFQQFKRLLELVNKHNIRVEDFGKDPRKIATLLQCYRFPNIGISTLLGVHFSLFGCTVYFLGSDEQRARYLDKVMNLELIGCFSLTELGHGSNVQQIETVAEYDHTREEFVLNSPTITSQKYFIGGAATNANHTVVFAQLKVGEKMEGVHAFVLKFRGDDGKPVEGVRVADCGHKMALNGVDNGRLMFKNVRLPRDQLLSRFGGVNKAGIYSSPINPVNKRFAHNIGALVFGRYMIALGSVSFSVVGISIALRYAFSRKQFSGDEPSVEKQLITYSTHQKRLIPHLANIYGAHFCNEYLLSLFADETSSPKRDKEIHIYASALKAYCSWLARDSLQEARECCGGQGFLSVNLIGPYKSETEIYTTFEGDNVLMYQQVSKFLLSEARKNPPPTYQVPTSYNTDSKYLRSIEFIQLALTTRLNQYVNYTVDQLTESVTVAGKSVMNSWNDSGNTILKLGVVYTEKVILDKFITGTQNCPDSTQQHALSLLLSLYALNIIDKDSWFLRYKFISSEQSEVINQQVIELCKELVPYSISLADAFNFDPKYLGPIARDWINENKY